ncbi:hypothetical protein [Thalassotalea aquiviva]|uniref:hypothetical protein n=1 Tax=Thalassotalea aquiviva TaxID=3242415 RepID=UPI00352B58FB
MEPKKYIEIGGSVEKALVGEYKISPESVLKEAWTLTKTNKQPIISGLLLVLLIGMILSFFAFEYMGGAEAVIADPQKQWIINLLATVVLYPFIAGVEMMGVSHSVGIKTRTGFVFAFLKRSAFIALAAVIVSSLTSLGFYLILPGIYLTVALSLTIPLIIEKQMSPVQAIILSLKATRFEWFNLFKIYAMLFALLCLSILPWAFGVPSIIAMPLFCVAMLWLAPMFYNVKGILYREIFGIKMQVVSSDKGTQSPDSYFSA